MENADNKRKTAIIFLAETQTTYDINGIPSIDEIGAYELGIVKKMWEIRKMMGADHAIYVLASPIGKDPETQTTDWNFSHIRGSAVSQTYMLIAKNGSTEQYDKGAMIGPCFYRDGYITINRSKGYGKWYPEEHVEEGPAIDKVMEYLRRQFEEFDVLAFFSINDKGFSEKIVDLNEIKSYGVPVVELEPNIPYVKRYVDLVSIDANGSGVVHSKRICIGGVNDCLDLYIKHLEKIDEKRHHIEPVDN